MLKPLADRVLVKVDTEETQTKGGILLPDTAQKKSQKGEVIAIGSGKMLDNGTRVPFEVKVATESSLPNIPAWISKKMARNSCFSPKETYWGSCNKKYLGSRDERR